MAWRNVAGLGAIGRMVAAVFQDETQSVSHCTGPSLRAGPERLRFLHLLTPYPFLQSLVRILTSDVSVV